MLQYALSALLDAPIEIVDETSLGGGCISDVSVVRFKSVEAGLLGRINNRSGRIGGRSGEGIDGNKFVVKRNAASMEDNFRCEADGLDAIAEAAAIRVPDVYAVGRVDRHAYLVMQWIAPGRPRSRGETFFQFGQQLATLHEVTSGSQIGWPGDNYLGAAVQPNRPAESWPDFFARHRIGYQIRWAAEQGLLDGRLRTDCETIADSLDDLLRGRDDVTSLLHGDLWSGNYLFDTGHRAVLIDPAVYRGCREAEWGMISWFGGCPEEFEAGYQQRWAMPEGWRRRVAVYRLYHQLNHLNLFGATYAGLCQSSAAEILRQ